MTFIPSDEQQAIFDAVLRDNVKALAIAALAGTGKTTTLVELAKHLPAEGTKMFCAFNTSIVGELKERLSGTGMEAKTFHSLGYAGLSLTLNAGKLNLDKDKYRNLVRRWMAETTGASDEPSLFRVALDRATAQFFELTGIESFLEKLAIAVLNWVRIKLIAWDNEDAIMGMITHYRLMQDIDEMRADFSIGANVALDGLITMLVQSVSRLMTEAERQVRQSRTVDFTDQIYWVVYWNAPIKTYDMVFVDECQDLSPMQRELVARSVRRTTGRIVLVGDTHQAIYEFSGADSDSFDLSVAKFNAVVLPLTLTRRCAKVITLHAAALVPSFRCPSDKPDGKVIWIEEAEFVERAKPGDMVLCRMRAPLVGNCLRLLALGIPATILGADIGKSLLGLLGKIEKRGDYRSFDDVLTVIGTYRDEQVSRALSRDDEDLAARITDECQAITELIKLTNPPNMITLRVKLETLFSEGSVDNKVMFSTIHKAKGLERERVFIIAPDRLPLIFGQRKDGKPSKQRPESIAQEYNLDYVARTRAINTLVYVTNPTFLQKTPPPPYAQIGWDAPAHPVYDLDDDDTETFVSRESGIALNMEDSAAITGEMPAPVIENSPAGEFSTPSMITTAQPTDKRKLLGQLCDTLTLDELDLLLQVIQQARDEKASEINGTAAR